MTPHARRSVTVENLESNLRLVTIDRPHVRNALDNTTLEELIEAVAADQGAPSRVLAFAGTGGTFSAGSDLKAAAAGDRDYHEHHTLLGQQLMNAIESAPALTVALVSGYCLGGGLELALACDLRIAAASSTWGFPEITLGAVPSFGGTQRIGRYVGLGRAKQLVLLADRFDASEAHRLGIANWVVSDLSAAVEHARLLAQRVDGFDGHALPALKRLVASSFDTTLTDGLAREREAEACLEADRIEAL